MFLGLPSSPIIPLARPSVCKLGTRHETKAVQHVPRIILMFSGFQVFQNIPGSQLLSDIQTFFNYLK